MNNLTTEPQFLLKLYSALHVAYGINVIVVSHNENGETRIHRMDRLHKGVNDHAQKTKMMERICNGFKYKHRTGCNALLATAQDHDIDKSLDELTYILVHHPRKFKRLVQYPVNVGSLSVADK